MKTIRNNVFETNSSSTHSITIQSKKKRVKESPLIKGEFLYPKRLVDYSNNMSGYSESSILILDTMVAKAAWLCSSLYNIDVSDFCDDNDIEEEILDKSVSDYISLILGSLRENGYPLVKSIPKNQIGNYSCFSCEDVNDVEDAIKDLCIEFDAEGFNKKIIKDIILNDDVVIVDERSSN